MSETPDVIYVLAQRSECGHAPGITYSLENSLLTGKLAPAFVSAEAAAAYCDAEGVCKSYRVTPLSLTMPKLKLWLIERQDAACVETFRSAVVAAYTEVGALAIPTDPSKGAGWKEDWAWQDKDWIECTDKTVTCLGYASAEIKPNSVIHAYFITP